MPEKIDLEFQIDPTDPDSWRCLLVGINPEALIAAVKKAQESSGFEVTSPTQVVFDPEKKDGVSVANVIIGRGDNRFFKSFFTRATGHLAPLIFQNRDKAGKIGSVVPIIQWNGRQGYIVVEEAKFVNEDGLKVSGTRATRASVDNPAGSPIPRGTKKPGIHPRSWYRLDNQRLVGQVAVFAVVQPYGTELKQGQHLMTFAEFAETGDAPGQAALFKYLHGKRYEQPLMS